MGNEERTTRKLCPPFLLFEAFENKSTSMKRGRRK
jgi:hypothetical protein